MYPMMPHMAASSALVLPHLLPHALGPARLDHLPSPPQSQRICRHVLRHNRARPDHGAASDRDRRDQGPVAPDASVAADDRIMILVPVIVGRDGALPDADAATELRVIE